MPNTEKPKQLIVGPLFPARNNAVHMLPFTVAPINRRLADHVVVANHYLHRKPPNSFSFGLFDAGSLCGVCVLGVPPSRHLQVSVCNSQPDLVLELNRLWIDDSAPRNSESFFISRVLRQLPPRIICSYADCAVGHVGYIYRASNWLYAGYTDMERKTRALTISSQESIRGTPSELVTPRSGGGFQSSAIGR